MANQIPRRQIIQNQQQVQDTNIRRPQIRPMDMPQYDFPMPPSRPMQIEDTDTRTVPVRPTPADVPETQFTQVEPRPQTTTELNLADTPIGVPVFNPEFTQGYLRQNIGMNVKVEFLIGTNMFVDRQGKLVDVGISYIILEESDTDDLLLCDIYSIKFVTFYR